jgi:UDP-N-acetylglucosamine 3-dehydrogenase
MPSSRRYRIGIIGAGAIAQALHFPGYKKDRRANIVAFADPAEERHGEVLGRFGKMMAYRDYRTMLRHEELDVVSVATPNAFHARQAVAALEAGCHVLCEKPIATTLAEADRILDAATRNRRKLMVGFSHRMFTGPQKCKELLAQRRLGTPYMIRVRFAHGGPYPGWAKNSWFYNKKLSKGGAMLDMGIHAIDLCHWLIGPIANVSARAATLIKKIEVDDNALLQLEFKDGALGYIEVGWTSPPGFSGFEIYGTKGSLICDYGKGLSLCTGTSSAGRDSTMAWKLIDDKPTRGGWDVEIGHWLDVLDGKARLTMDGRAGRNALAVALAAYESSRTGKRIALNS